MIKLLKFTQFQNTEFAGYKQQTNSTSNFY